MKRALYIQDEGVYLFEDKALSGEQVPFFEWNRLEALRQVLAQIKKSERLYLVLDVVDEDITFEWKPKLFPWEKSQYLKLENARADREGALLKRFQWTGMTRKTDKQLKEELLLKSIVLKNEHIVELLQTIEDLELRLSGIYSISYIIDQWFHKVARSYTQLANSKLKSPFFLLVRLTKYRFRQLFYFNGLLKISRDFKVDSQLEAEPAIQSAVMHESQAALKYLYNQKIVPYNEPVSMVLIDIHGQKREGWRLFFEENYLNKAWSKEEWFFVTLNFSTLAKSKDKRVEALSGQSVFALFAIDHKLPNYYPHEYLSKVISFRLVSHTVYGGIFLCALFILFYGVYQGVNLYFLQQKISLYQQQIVAYQEEKSRLQKIVNLTYDAKDFKDSVEFSQALLQLKNGQNSGINWLPIMQVLDRSDHILIKTLNWKVLDKIDGNIFVVEMEGWVFPFKESFRPPTQWVDQFVQSLKEASNTVEVSLTKEPLNRSLSQSLVVSSSDIEVQALPFQVTLKVKRND